MIPKLFQCLHRCEEHPTPEIAASRRAGVRSSGTVLQMSTASTGTGTVAQSHGRAHNSASGGKRKQEFPGERGLPGSCVCCKLDANVDVLQRPAPAYIVHRHSPAICNLHTLWHQLRECAWTCVRRVAAEPARIKHHAFACGVQSLCGDATQRSITVTVIG